MNAVEYKMNQEQTSDEWMEIHETEVYMLMSDDLLSLNTEVYEKPESIKITSPWSSSLMTSKVSK